MKTAFILFAALCCLVMASFVVGEYVEADDDFEVSEVNVRDVELMEGEQGEHSVAVTFVNKRGELEKRLVNIWYIARALLSYLNPGNKAWCTSICISHKDLFGSNQNLASSLCPQVCRIAIALISG